MTKISVRLGWIAEGYDAPLLAAFHEGWFKDAGLDLTIGQGSGSGTTTKLIGNGSDTIGFADSGTVAKAIAQGVPVKVIAGIFQKSPLATIYRDDAGIKAPKDLEGKPWGVTAGSGNSQIQPVFLAVNGIDPTKMTSVNMDASALDATLMAGKVMAIDSYAIEELPKINIALGGHASAFEWADYGVKSLGQGVIASDDTIKNKPDMLRTFLKVLARGWQLAMDHPDQAAADELAEIPTSGSSNKQVIMEQIRLTIPKLHTTNSAGKPLFWMSDQDWTDTQDTLAKYGGLNGTRPISAYFTNEFQPQP